ncbi:MAG TPA: DsrE family protein [Bryobacteraceae bacterium]|nr:DsrE family protein [Bryobacteraceae bacterium]
MKTRLLFLIAVFAILTTAVLVQAQQNAAPAKHRVVFQMNMPAGDSWNQLLGNVNNIRKVFAADGIQVEVVFYGKGLTALLKTNKDYEERLKQLASDGVILGACQNTMRIMKVTSADIFPFSTEVDSGVAELVRKQEAGWTYIRAGE